MVTDDDADADVLTITTGYTTGLTTGYTRGATFWAFFKNFDAPIFKSFIGHQLTNPKNRRHQFGNPKTSIFGPILAYVQKKAYLAILKPPSGAMIVPNFWYWA